MATPEREELMTEEGRALVTDREREIISGDADVSDNYEYKVKSVVRNRIRKRLGDDVNFLKEHFPEAHDLVVDEVCGGDDAKQHMLAAGEAIEAQDVDALRRHVRAACEVIDDG